MRLHPPSSIHRRPKTWHEEISHEAEDSREEGSPRTGEEEEGADAPA